MKAKTRELFVKESIYKHGTKYDYSQVVYINNKTKVTIICPIHGKFEQQPNNHLNSEIGCPKCSKEQIGISKRITLEHFLSRARSKQGDRYYYHKVNFETTRDTIIITCRIHGDFKQTIGNHLKGDHCPHCSKIGNIRKKRYTQEEFIELANKVHNSKYDYSQVLYKGVRESVKIICPVHGEFNQKPNSHLKGYGCNSCSNYSFDKNKPAMLYYLKIITDDNKVLYKIGITSRTLNERFNLNDLRMITVLDTKQLSSGQEAYNLEQSIIKKYEKYRCKNETVLSSGNTELFNKDILPKGLLNV